MKLIRSFLFAPGSNPSVMQKALNAGADAVIFDLEDAVAVSEKDNARKLVCEEVMRECTHCRKYVRINSWDTSWSKEDLIMAVDAGADGIMLPKSEDPAVVKAVAEFVPREVDFIPLIETAKGILNTFEIATCSKRISRLAFGAIDFTLDVGGIYSKNGTELLYARSQMVVASRVAELYPPVDTVYPDLVDFTGLETELTQIRHLGMFGKLAIHPKQLPLIHHAFTPQEVHVEEAFAITKAFEAAEKEGCASIEINGKFVDYPVYIKAKRIIELSNSLANCAG